MPAYLVVEEIDSVKRTATARWRINPLSLTSAFVTAANAVPPVMCGAAKVSSGGVPRMYYEGDLVHALTPALANSDVRGDWALTSQSTGARPSKQKIHAPLLSGNLAPGSLVRALLSSTAWAAYVAALESTDFKWLDNFGNAAPVLLGGISTVRARVAPREKTTVAPTPTYGGHLVISIRDAQNQGANFRICVTQLTLDSAWSTAALALIAATYGTGKVSRAGYVRVFLEQDILTTPIAPQAETNVRFKWVMKSEAGTEAPFEQNIACPLVDGNLVSGDQIIADKNSAEWTALIAALTATDLGWLSNKGTASPAVIGATSAAVPRKNPRERVR